MQIPDNKLALKPKKGLKLRDPKTKRVLDADGGLVPDTIFWRRRVRNGDAEKLDAKAWAEVKRKSDEAKRKAKAEKAAAEDKPKPKAEKAADAPKPQ